MSKSKLTQTTNDQLQAGTLVMPRSDGGIIQSQQPHITAAHEPLRDEPVVLPPILPEFPALSGAIDVQTTPVPPPILNIPPAQPLKIALVGTAPSSRMLAPYNDPSWKIWGCSPGATAAPALAAP